MTMEKGFEEDAPAEAAPAGISGLPAEPAEGAAHRLGEQLREAQDRHLRLAAEFDNFRKRIAKERLELTDRAQAALVMRLTDILDDVDRIAASEPSTAAGALLEAILLVDKKLRKELEAAGLERLDPVGQPFNPAFHEAVAVLLATSPEQDHQVAATFQVGYRFRGSLVRPARVQVYSTEGHG